MKNEDKVCDRANCRFWSSRLLNNCDALREVILEDCPFYKEDSRYF